MRKHLPLVSVIIVNFNGRPLLIDCLKSVMATAYPAFEVIVVDNGSTDDSVASLNREGLTSDAGIRIIALERNHGPARARNEGARAAGGRYLAFLDNDTQVDPAWITNAVAALEKDGSVGAVQCKLLFQNEPGKFDCAGEFLGPSGFLVQRAKYKETDHGQHDGPVDLLAAKSAGMFTRADVFREIGGFDEDYFIYMEETDLCWRSWLRGHRTIFCAGSVVYHTFSSTKDIVDSDTNNYLVRFHGTKNYIMTLIKNLGSWRLLVTLPVHISMWLGLAIYFMFRGNARSALNIIRGIGWNILHLPATLRKRWLVQRGRLVPDSTLLKTVMQKDSLLNKVRQVTMSQKVTKTPENI